MILLSTVGTIVALIAFLFIPLSLATGHPQNVIVEVAVLVVCLWYVARVMRGDRRQRLAAEAALPPERRPGRRAPRQPVTFQLRETVVAFVIWFVIVFVFGNVAMGLPPTVNTGVAIFAGFMLATITVAGRHMMFRMTAGDDEPS